MSRRPISALAVLVMVVTAAVLLVGPGPASSAVAAAERSTSSPSAPRVDTGDIAHDAGLQWGFDRIRAQDGWRIGRGASMTIAVIDSGVALEHEDLSARLVRGVACRGTGGDQRRCAGSAQDDDGHGTHVAGIAAATAGNGPGIAGVAPDARIMPIKVLFRDCPDCPSSGDAEDVVAAIDWAVANGADIINLSLGSTESAVFGPGFTDAIDRAWRAGVIAVIAAGNQFVLTADFGDTPAVVVAATTRDDGVPSYGNGVGTARWSVAAPGGDEGDTAQSCAQNGTPIGVLSTYWSPGDNSAYACLSGTSMAAPHVSGALAVLRSAGLGPDQAIDALRSTAVDLGTPGVDRTFGAGLIDLGAAADKAAATPTTVAPPPTTAPTSTAPPATEPATTIPDQTSNPTDAPTTTGGDPSTSGPGLDRDEEVAGRAVLLREEDGGERRVAAGVAALSALSVAAALGLARRRRMF